MRPRNLLLLATTLVASSVFAARAEVGAATVEVRTLFNRDATTDLEITTNGTIARIVTPEWDLELSQPRRFSTKLDGLLPEAAMHVRTYVVVNDPNHHDIVDLDEVVKRRPDLFVSEIVAPPQAVAGVPTVIRATVRELNGDHGARANCRLFADGLEIDRAEGISIEAGATVQCAFAPLFTAGGVQQLAVVVDGVDPGDWDDSNNTSAVTTIRINDSAFGGFSASVREEAFANRQAAGTLLREVSGIAQSFRFDAWLRQSMSEASLTATSNGETLFAGKTPVVRPNGARCAVTLGTPEVTVCDVPRLGAARVDLFYGSGDVIHRSDEWMIHFGGTQTKDVATPFAPIARFEGPVELQVILGRFRETLTIRLARLTSTWDVPPTCSGLCVEIHEERSILTGHVVQSRKGGFSLK
ncbi:MAG TPA: hypothetical protein VGF48_25860 [Thermoanaerobaculia bacterium]|jgi:hypothetical protein